MTTVAKNTIKVLAKRTATDPQKATLDEIRKLAKGYLMLLEEKSQ